MSNFVTIIAVSDVKQDKNGRNYKRLRIESPSFEEVVDPITGEIGYALARPIKTTITAYEQSYLDDAPDYLWNAVAGTKVKGSIQRRTVAPYTFKSSNGDTITATKATVFVEANATDEDFDVAVAKALEASGHTLVESLESILAKSVNTTPEKEEVKQEAEKEEEKEEVEEAVAAGAFSVVSDDADELEDEF
ncbi:hypothetical protein PP178_04160 [Zeaxanthinibacter sp. PT1]|uniref:hypothetical protein n=1 Tax=Zeaxanthinibacter TaxID=561554 RepID=UPI00234A2462|nr:hypothetical protein [Zeaxanthinibacter sp. PT1]MDC6350735.1 hypothetical protein [Zeaxanthinibacter sp. PT1]